MNRFIVMALFCALVFMGCDQGQNATLTAANGNKEEKIIIPIEFDVNDIAKLQKSLSVEDRRELLDFKIGIVRYLEVVFYDTAAENPGEIFKEFMFDVIDGRVTDQIEMPPGVYNVAFYARSYIAAEFSDYLENVELLPGKISKLHLVFGSFSTTIPVRIYSPIGTYQENTEYEVKIVGSEGYAPNFSACNKALYYQDENPELCYLEFVIHIYDPYEPYVILDINGNQMLVPINIMDYVDYGPPIKTIPSEASPVVIEIDGYSLNDGYVL